MQCGRLHRSKSRAAFSRFTRVTYSIDVTPKLAFNPEFFIPLHADLVSDHLEQRFLQHHNIQQITPDSTTNA